MIYSNLSPQLAQLYSHLHEVGYHEPDGTIIRDYLYLAADGKKHSADLLAFGNPRKYDISTSCIAAQECFDGQDRDQSLHSFRYAGVPVVLLAYPNHVEVCSASSTESDAAPQPQDRLSYDNLPEYFHTHGRDLAPRSLLSAKRGERQLTFFDVDLSLEQFAREQTQTTLVRQFESAIGATSPHVRQSYPKAVTRLAICVLAACMLQDKLTEYQDLQTRDVLDLLQAVRRHFPAYFTKLQSDIKHAGKETVAQLYEVLRSEFTFRSLTNDMLAYFYENTLVNPEARRELGIYYTPRVLAQRILHRLPVEDLRPENRNVLDGTCGSGNLLLAAYDRLSQLLPVRWEPVRSHEYLLSHLWGVDQDEFACEVARLSLLLYDLPAGDSWRVQPGDVFHIDPAHDFGQQPHIIVGNPPFEEPRSTDGIRKQKAALVLDRYLRWLAPEGLLGIVLPRTFLQNTSSTETRKALLEQCDILETWHLPAGMISGSSAETAVILARKHTQARTSTHGLLTRIEEVPRNSSYADSRYGQAAISYVTSQQAWLSRVKYQMASSPLEPVWRQIEKTWPRIDPTFCKIRNGVNPGSEANTTHFSDKDEGLGWRPVLRGCVRSLQD